MGGIRLFVEKALQRDIGTGAVELVSVADSESEPCKIGQSNGEHLTFSIPYAGTAQIWELIFNAQQLQSPPDFLCLSEDFDYDPETYTQVSCSWDITDLDCVSKLLQKLYQVFKLCQIQQLKNLPIIDKYFHTLVKSGIPEEHIEIHHDKKTRNANLLVKLVVKTGDLPLYEDTSYGVIFAGLLLTFKESGNLISMSLSMSPYLQRVLGPYLETFPLLNGNDTFDCQFVHEFTEAINRNLKTISNHLICRRHIIATLMSLYPKNIAAFDEYSYSYGTLLFSFDQFRHIVHFNLNERIELVLFALDKYVGLPDDRCIYIETENFSIDVSPDHPRFTAVFHENLKERITKFVNNAASLE